MVPTHETSAGYPNQPMSTPKAYAERYIKPEFRNFFYQFMKSYNNDNDATYQNFPIAVMREQCMHHWFMDPI